MSDASDISNVSNEWVKYPKTPYLPWSDSVGWEDKKIISLDNFIGKEVVVTEKLDGERSSLYNNGMHARSINETYHSSRAWLKALQSMIAPQIVDGMRISGENVFAKHTIYYDRLSSYFYVYAIFENGQLLHWDDIEDLCKYFKYSLKVRSNHTREQYQVFHLETAPVLYRGIWDEDKIKACYTGKSVFGDEQEGYVVRTVESFPESEFSSHVAKYVKKDFIPATDSHWMHKTVIPNKLIRDSVENLKILK